MQQLPDLTVSNTSHILRSCNDGGQASRGERNAELQGYDSRSERTGVIDLKSSAGKPAF